MMNEKNNYLRRKNDITKLYAQKIELQKKKHFDEMNEQVAIFQRKN